MGARDFLNSKGIYSLDTKKRMLEVISWMEGYAATCGPDRKKLIETINTTVDENQCLGAEEIADAILKAHRELKL